ncbi:MULTISPECIES: DUF3179 domain-containing protein [Haloferax]|uniref:DUF3179 domain-containing protein n=1 Tax=Haloferax marinum TaxID=2666143 RepID=A0A6A8G236_9EURY|nr:MULTISPECIES: DUF3179 domain-containing protein [Haloferax]KAB1196090.1 DUF3179 domain-containing protein [Haloferax sp. CBA1150]MRW95071.1 DUF3179 domain-containing protein [Haloferax marinum]
MDRRAFLALAVTAGVSLAGCGISAVRDSRPPQGDSRPPQDDDPVRHISRSILLPVSESDLRQSVARDAIPAITSPAFAPNWDDVEIELDGGTYRPQLGHDDLVVGVELDGDARAYPLRILSWHEVVNDRFGDRPVLVTYCPLCQSGMVATRRVDGREANFGVSGYLWNDNLVMYDTATESLWSQLLATAIRGPATETRLELLPATVTTWGEWRDAVPETTVLLPPPVSDTVVGEVRFNYGFDLYDQWARVWDAYPDMAPGSADGDTRLSNRELVVGVRDGNTARAYAETRVRWAGVVIDTVGSVPVVVTTAPGYSLVAYDRRIDGTTYRFARDGDELVGGGSRWNVQTGVALDGPHEDARLSRANEYSPMLWFAWLAFNPETDVWNA